VLDKKWTKRETLLPLLELSHVTIVYNMVSCLANSITSLLPFPKSLEAVAKLDMMWLVYGCYGKSSVLFVCLATLIAS
jgi:hypothetical protein